MATQALQQNRKKQKMSPTVAPVRMTKTTRPLIFNGLFLPPEVVANIAGFACRCTLNKFMLASKGIYDVVQNKSMVSKPWPTNKGSALLNSLCPDLSPKPACNFHNAKDYAELIKCREAHEIIPHPETTILQKDYSQDSSSYLLLSYERIPQVGFKIKRRILQVWSVNYGLLTEEYIGQLGIKIKPIITPPLGKVKSQFLILQNDSWYSIRMVELLPPPLQKQKGTNQRIDARFHGLCRTPVESVGFIGNIEDPALIFMEQGESAVKICNIILEENSNNINSNNQMRRTIRLTSPETLISDPTHRDERRCTLATFSSNKKTLVAFSYDFDDKFITIYDFVRKVHVSLPILNEKYWVRDVTFSPDGKTILLAHSIDFSSYNENEGIPTAGISIYDCNVEQIEDLKKRKKQAKFVPLVGAMFIKNISFSPKGKKLVASCYIPTDRAFINSPFDDSRAGVLDMLQLSNYENSDGDPIQISLLNEALWENFISS